MPDNKKPTPTPTPAPKGKVSTSNPWSLGTGMAGKAQETLKNRTKSVDDKLKEYGV